MYQEKMTVTKWRDIFFVWFVLILLVRHSPGLVFKSCLQKELLQGIIVGVKYIVPFSY